MNTMKRKVALTVVLALGALSSASFHALAQSQDDIAQAIRGHVAACIVDTTSR